VNSDVYLYGKKSMTRLMLFAKVIWWLKGIILRIFVWVLPYQRIAELLLILCPIPLRKSWATEQKHQGRKGRNWFSFPNPIENYWGIEEDADAIPRSSDGQLLFLMEMVSKMKSLLKSPYRYALPPYA
jgi:type I restriction enzyme M protein